MLLVRKKKKARDKPPPIALARSGGGRQFQGPIIFGPPDVFRYAPVTNKYLGSPDLQPTFRRIKEN